jgi:hypothetical protein
MEESETGYFFEPDFAFQTEAGIKAYSNQLPASFQEAALEYQPKRTPARVILRSAIGLALTP